MPKASPASFRNRAVLVKVSMSMPQIFRLCFLFVNKTEHCPFILAGVAKTLMNGAKKYLNIFLLVKDFISENHVRQRAFCLLIFFATE